MKLHETDLPGCLIGEFRIASDARGWLYEAYNRDSIAAAGLRLDVAQVNVSRSLAGILRGLHYQWPNPQGKWISALEGEVWDVAVDLRRGSPHFGRWTGTVLSAKNRRQFWVPEGFAHGFAVLGDAPATVHYLCTRTYDPSADAGIRWNDAALAIDWPLSHPVLSDKDAHAPLLEQTPAERLPQYLPPD